MALYDEKHAEFLSILEAQRFTEKDVWEKTFLTWLDHKIESINLNKRNISGNLLQPYLASMRYSSKAALDILMSIGFNPTYQILQKRMSILSVYLSSSDNLSVDMLNYHLDNVAGFYADTSDAQRDKKLFDYVNEIDPFLGRDALINLVTRKSNHVDASSKISERNIIECLKVLLAQGADLTRSDRNNYTALHWAIIEGNARVAIHLIRNANLDVCTGFNASGETPLSLAAKNGHRDVCLALLKKGVSPNGYSTTNEISNIPDSMTTKLAFNNPLLLALRSGHVGISSDLVSCGANYPASMNSHDMHTALIYAVKLNSPELMDGMLRHGFDPNEVNSHGFTPLLYLVSNMAAGVADQNAQRMVSSLIKQGASVDVMSKNGLYALDLIEEMAKKGDDFCMQLLFDRNVETLKKFVSASSGIQVHDIADLQVSDDQLADMKQVRIENVSSVWLNRAMKTDEYRDSILAAGKSNFKEVAFSPFIGGSAVYGILKGIGEYAEKNSAMPLHDLVSMAVNNIGSITAACAVITAGVMAYRTLSDESKRYALGFWLNKTSSELVDRYIDPILKAFESVTDEKIVRLTQVIRGLRERVSEVASRIGAAYGVLTGKIDVAPKAALAETDQVPENVVKLPKVRQDDRSNKLGMG